MKTQCFAFLILGMLGCGDSAGPSSPSLPPGPAPLQISGFVSQLQVVPTASGNFANVNYEVTISASRGTTGCWVEVKFLNADGLQIFNAFPGVSITFSQGETKITDQSFQRIDTARAIEDTQVEFSLCD